MDIALGARVECTDGPYGQVSDVVLNPKTEQITHIVVATTFLESRRMVPIEWVIECTPARVCLNRTRAEVAQAELYVEIHTLDEQPDGHDAVAYTLWPLSDLDAGIILVEHKRIPKGELEVRRTARVIALDGQVGKVDAFLVGTQGGAITHLVLREGHLWGQRDVTIPVAEIERIEDNTVYLKVTKRAVEILPSVPARARRKSG